MRPMLAALRGVAVLGACAGVAAVCWWLTDRPVADVLGPVVERGPGSLGTLRFDTLALGLAALALLGCAGWLVLTTAVATTLELASQLAPDVRSVRLLERAVDRWSPVLVRRLVVAVLGTAVTAGLAAAPSIAAPPGDGDHGVSGLAIPDRTTGSAGAVHRPTAPEGSPRAGVVVRPGDCLWSIAAGQLPATATDAEVVTAWHHLHAANRDRIGPDPDLIVPGTHLVVPDLTPQREEAP